MINLQQPSGNATQHDFSKGPRADITRSAFTRTRNINTAFDSGYIVPIFWDDLLPGDTISIKPHLFARLSNPLQQAPVTGLWLDTFWFDCPQRLVWMASADDSGSWERFNGQQDFGPDDPVDFTMPLITIPDAGFAANSIFDYFGLPVGIANNTAQEKITADLLRAYNLIINTWFRDENLSDALPMNTDDGPDDPTDYTLVRRWKRHDYFTACLPWPQKGNAISISLGTSAPITGTFVGPAADEIGSVEFRPAGGAFSANNLVHPTAADPDSVNIVNTTTQGAGLVENKINQNSLAFDVTGQSLVADLTSATAVTVNALRQAIQIQGLLERDAQGGTRYIEVILAHFGVRSDDARLQRPELIFTTSERIGINPVANTAAASGGRPMGALGSYGSVFSRGFGRKSSTEHSMVLGFAQVRGDNLYHQGIERRWSRRTRFDFPWPALMHLGEQAVLNKEIWLSNSTNPVTGNDGVFGYIPRYDEYRFAQSRATGPMRPTSAGTGFGDLWTMIQFFTGLPVLDDPAFILDNPPVARASVTTFTPQIMLDGYVQVEHVRPMPVRAVPATLSRF